MIPDPAGPSASAARLEQFRAKPSRQKIHPAEEALLWVIGAQVTFLPWALGGTRHWAHWVSLGLSCAALVISLLPREYTDVPPGQVPFRLYTWAKLLRFPIFWLGLAFLGYIIIQASNPAWVYQTDGKKWWMQKIPYIEWLPSGVSVPFERYGPWHMLVIYASVFFAVCAVWIGFTRRRSLQTLFTVIAGNAFLLAILGIAQRATGATKIFWFWEPPAAYFVSSFIYKNHAGAYFNLVLALCVGLALWHYERGLRRLDKSSPSGLFAFFATAVAMIVLFSYSRTATILMLLFLPLAVLIFYRRKTRQAGATGNTSPVAAISVVLVVGAFLYLGKVSLQTQKLIDSLAYLREQLQTSGLGLRSDVASATWDMAKESPLFGWGSGSFRFCFPLFQVRYPEIGAPNVRMYWEHAHNDYAELSAELGAVGMSLLLGMATYAVWRFLRVRAWRNPVSLFGALGVVMVILHSFVDFNAYNPAILTTGCVLMLVVIRWAEIEASTA